jgi:Na+/pantothenate symporter
MKLTNNLRLLLSFIASLGCTSTIVLISYIHDITTLIGGVHSPFMTDPIIYVILLVPGTVLLWRCMAIIFGAETQEEVTSCIGSGDTSLQQKGE